MIEIGDVDPVRSRIMASVRGKDTKPEMRIRRALHALGLRYRLHVRGLAGKPDIVFGPSRVAVFVHGCFWHRHDCVNGRRQPRQRAAFWADKFERNVERDGRTAQRLRREGWAVETVWECEATKVEDVERQAGRIADLVRHRRPARSEPGGRVVRP